MLELVGTWGRRHVHDLADPFAELLEPQRPVVDRARQPEPVLDERSLSGDVTLVHAVELRDRHVRLVEHDKVVVGEIVEQGERCGAGVASVDVPGVVLDAAAKPHLAEHLEVVVGAHAQPFGFQELALPLEQREPLAELLLDRDDRPLHPLVGCDVVRRRERRVVDDVVLDDLAGERIEHADPLHLVAPPFDPVPAQLVRREDLQGVAA